MYFEVRVFAMVTTANETPRTSQQAYHANAGDGKARIARALGGGAGDGVQRAIAVVAALVVPRGAIREGQAIVPRSDALCLTLARKEGCTR